MKNVLLILLLACVPTLPLQAAENSMHVTDRAQIQKLVDDFQRAIRTKDGQALNNMFQPGAAWLMGLDKASLAKVRIKKPNASQFKLGNYAAFGKFISNAPKPNEEIFDNVRIETDGIVGIVYFKYRYLVDGELTNHGTETWQLVHSDKSWKISSMLYPPFWINRG